MNERPSSPPTPHCSWPDVVFTPPPLPLFPDGVGVRDACGCTVASPESPPPPSTPSHSREKTHVHKKDPLILPNIPRIASVFFSLALNLSLSSLITGDDDNDDDARNRPRGLNCTDVKAGGPVELRHGRTPLRKRPKLLAPVA